MKIKVVVLMMAMALFSVGAKCSNVTNAKDLHDFCKVADRYDLSDKNVLLDSSESLNMGQCTGFMNGWLQGVNGLVTIMDEKPYVVNFADGVTVGQMLRVFILIRREAPRVRQ